jgi:hypothetical protein
LYHIFSISTDVGKEIYNTVFLTQYNLNFNESATLQNLCYKRGNFKRKNECSVFRCLRVSDAEPEPPGAGNKTVMRSGSSFDSYV